MGNCSECVVARVGSGIYVDLGRNTEEYREVSGKCPVFGKVIELHQPADYQNDFLADVPSALQARRKPLPGGFNSPYVDTTGRKFSPISDSVLKEKLGGENMRSADVPRILVVQAQGPNPVSAEAGGQAFAYVPHLSTCQYLRNVTTSTLKC